MFLLYNTSLYNFNNNKYNMYVYVVLHRVVYTGIHKKTKNIKILIIILLNFTDVDI